MYLEYFGLSRPPFNLIPDPDYLYLSDRHRLGLSLLRYGLTESGGGLTVITGHIGAGKTTLLRTLLRETNHGNLNIGLIDNTLGLPEHLIRWVASAFQLDYENREGLAVFRNFQRYLIDQYARGRQTVLIIDEAQNLTDKVLEELRLLTNINAERDLLLKVILVGQPELLEVLSQPRLAQLAQRVSVEYHLEPLSLDDTRAYIRHRMQVAGATTDPFEECAVCAIYVLSGGVPRLINTLCDQALVYAFALDKKAIDIEAALEVARGRRIGGINRFAPSNTEVDAVRRELMARHGVDPGLLLEPRCSSGTV